jgi:4-hydroxy-tetrahydrodipicolinate reductase
MVQQNPETALSGALERPDHPRIGEDAGRPAGLGDLGVEVSGSLREAASGGDVLIDFSAPRATLENLRTAVERSLAIVIGTTGFSKENLDEIKELAKQTRCVIAPNMSVGVNVMFKIIGEMAGILGNDFDIEILEAHHRFKKDAPSGTALRLGQIAAAAVDRDLEEVGVYERRGQIGQRGDAEIGIQTWRAGDITGEHTVMFGGIGERLEVSHRAHNRDNFARGAVRAALWLLDQPPGLYDMQDVLGLR